MQTALITGASRGIGRAIAEALAPDHHLLIGGRDSAAVDAVMATLPSAEPFVCELTDDTAVETAVAGMESLDVLVHSAGGSPLGAVADVGPEVWRDVLAVNLVAPANLTRLLLPALRRASGHVVFINSGAGLTARAGWSAYAASKFGLRALADSLRAEENGVVKVTSIHPGRTATDMQRAVREFEGESFDPKEFLSPEAVAATVRLALDAPANASIDTLTIRPV
ncbi:SDR family oxidoreductase [Micropruina glycogenica]|uniref:NADP-dependent 3-hydroxy acid dehydrogenase YdfG n=1 Tax=Micropruina glycogenica TaxID=75385 RepID=A0A2N9JI87_9ACTN|nr:SDR family oxidoreductase [Micropruina glycogenica]SPD87231.1 NADP-dependent 3-hydroxy acid dehydrogenase YdfG [Micropruina glycogenica]